MLKVILIVAPIEVRGEESKGDELLLGKVRILRAFDCQLGVKGCRVLVECRSGSQCSTRPAHSRKLTLSFLHPSPLVILQLLSLAPFHQSPSRLI
jgi:hypothetical protein